MALPVALTAGWASIILKPSPNSIIGYNGEDAPIVLFGIISSVIGNLRPELAAGQSVMFETNDNQKKVIYSNDTYFLVQEKDIIFIENALS